MLTLAGTCRFLRVILSVLLYLSLPCTITLRWAVQTICGETDNIPQQVGGTSEHGQRRARHWRSMVCALVPIMQLYLQPFIPMRLTACVYPCALPSSPGSFLWHGNTWRSIASHLPSSILASCPHTRRRRWWCWLSTTFSVPLPPLLRTCQRWAVWWHRVTGYYRFTCWQGMHWRLWACQV